MVTSYLPPMVAAYPLTVTRVSEDEEPGGQKRAQYCMDASQPWSPQGFASKFWILQEYNGTEVEKPVKDKTYWACFSRQPQPTKPDFDGTRDWMYRWRVVDGTFGMTEQEAIDKAEAMAAVAPAPQVHNNGGGGGGGGGGGHPQVPLGNSLYTKDELIVRQVAGKIAGDMIASQVIMPENFAEWLEHYYKIMMGYTSEPEGETNDNAGETADVQQQGD